MVSGGLTKFGTNLGIEAFSKCVRISSKNILLTLSGRALFAFSSGIGMYALETEVFKIGNYSQNDLWKSGIELGLMGLLNSGSGMMFGNQGFYSINNGKMQRLFVEHTLIKPIEIFIEKLFEEL